MDLGTVVTVVELIQAAIAIYERIDGLPQQMKQLGKRMERLNMFLVRLQKFLEKGAGDTKGEKHAQTQLLSGQLDDLRKLLKEIKVNAEKVHNLFYRYENGILSQSKGLTFRMPWMKQLWFSIVDNSADKIEVIMEDIDHQRSVLRDYLVLMSVEKAYEPKQRRRPAEDKTALTTAATATTTTARPTPSPSPAPPRRDYRILFVDPYNNGRSVMAEAVVKMLAQLTLRARRDWRIAEVRSAGFFARRNNECTDVIDGLDFSKPSFRLPWRAGGEAPSRTAVSAVFDNKWANYPFKNTIRSEIVSRTSEGLSKDVFTRFDFVFVFTVREHDNMVKLKDALRKKAGTGGSTNARGKGRVLQLGAYLAQKRGQIREILQPLPTKDSEKDREKWNRCVSEIRTAVKGFLKQEMKWTPPDSSVLASE